MPEVVEGDLIVVLIDLEEEVAKDCNVQRDGLNEPKVGEHELEQEKNLFVRPEH